MAYRGFLAGVDLASLGVWGLGIGIQGSGVKV